MKSSVLSMDLFLEADVVRTAKDLLGKVISTNFNGMLTSGIITETEAYAGVNDRASHAFGGKRTARNAPMFAQGGIAYVYLCYGIHHLFNIVTNVEGIPHAVLIRAIHPYHGLEQMAVRRKQKAPKTSGPGMVSQALAITTEQSGTDLGSGPIRIEDCGIVVPTKYIVSGPRIGVDYAGADALLPYRFLIPPSRLRIPNVI